MTISGQGDDLVGFIILVVVAWAAWGIGRRQ